MQGSPVNLAIILGYVGMSGCLRVSENVSNTCSPMGEGGHFVLLLPVASTKGVGKYRLFVLFAENEESANILFSFRLSKVRSWRISFLFQTFRKHCVLSSSH